MSTFSVIRRAGSGWTSGGIYEQPTLDEHAAFMNALADEGFVLFGGPLAGSELGRVRVLLIVDAESETEVHRRLAADPWALTGQLRVESIEPWKILVGAERFASVGDTPLDDGVARSHPGGTLRGASDLRDS